MAKQVSVKRILLVISDSTGETAATMMEAVVEQFAHPGVELQVKPHVRTEEEIRRLIESAERGVTLVAHTFANPGLRSVTHDLAAQNGISVIDLMGPLLARVSQWLDERPLNAPGRLHRLDHEYFRRIEALDFMMKNDDGQMPRNFPNAEMLIVGVSRSGKTPVCHVLAHKGYRVANLPLVPNQPVPKELQLVEPRRVFVLRIELPILLEIRRARHEQMNFHAESDYVNPAAIRKELKWVSDLTAAHPQWTVVDSTNRAVEEVSADILRCYTDRFGYQTI